MDAWQHKVRKIRYKCECNFFVSLLLIYLFSFVYAWAHVGTCSCVSVHVLMHGHLLEMDVWHLPELLSLTLLTYFWDRVFHWTWSLPISLTVWQVSVHPQNGRSVPECPPLEVLCSCLLLTWAFRSMLPYLASYVVLWVRFLVSMLVCKVFYPLSCFLGPLETFWVSFKVFQVCLFVYFYLLLRF